MVDVLCKSAEAGGRQDPENAKQDQPQIKADDKPVISVDPAASRRC